MARQIVQYEGAFTADTRKIINDNFTEIYSDLQQRSKKLQAVAAGGWLPNDYLGNGKYGRDDDRAEGRKRIRLAGSAISNIQLGFAGFYEQNSVGETNFGNDYQVEVAIENASPSAYQRSFTNNLTIATVPDGSQLLLSAPVGYNYDADTDIYTRVGYTTDSGATKKMPSNADQAIRSGDSFEFSTGYGVSQVAATGSITLPPGGIDYLVCGVPYLVLGVPTTPIPAVCVLGDSIADGYLDTGDNNGNKGFVQRGLWSVNGHAIARTVQTSGGDRLSFNQINNGSLKRVAWQYHTHLICQLSTNDIAAASSLAALQENAQAIWAAAKRVTSPYGRPMHVSHVTCAPRTTSVDNWTTPGGQTPQANFQAGGIRSQFNAWLVTQVGRGLLDAVIDPNVYIEDQANPGKFVTNGVANYITPDGIHLGNTGSTLAATAINNWAREISVL